MALAGDHVQVLMGGYNLTGDQNRIQIDDARQMHSVSAFSDAAKKFIPGQRMAKLQHTGYMNAVVARSHPVLKNVDMTGAVTILVGQNADPVAGDLAYSLDGLQARYRVMPQIDQVIPFNADFSPRGVVGGWGVALAIPTNITNTANGSAHDNGASTSQGGTAFLHLLTAAATDRYSIIVQGSSTGAFAGEETTVATFTLNGASLGTESIATTTTIPRYARWKANRISGAVGNTLQLAVTLVRY